MARSPTRRCWRSPSSRASFAELHVAEQLHLLLDLRELFGRGVAWRLTDRRGGSALPGVRLLKHSTQLGHCAVRGGWLQRSKLIRVGVQVIDVLIAVLH